MKIKSLNPKNDFLKFLSLAILVLGASLGVVLMTRQDKLLLNSKAAQCDPRDGGGFCKNNIRTYCGDNGRWITQNCGSKVCINYGPYTTCESRIGGQCDIYEGWKMCIDNKVVQCKSNKMTVIEDCGNNKTCEKALSEAFCRTKPPKPTSKPTIAPRPTTRPCSQSCVVRIECTENDGKVVSGTCSGGRVCCDF